MAEGRAPQRLACGLSPGTDGTLEQSLHPQDRGIPKSVTVTKLPPFQGLHCNGYAGSLCLFTLQWTGLTAESEIGKP